MEEDWSQFGPTCLSHTWASLPLLLLLSLGLPLSCRPSFLSWLPFSISLGLAQYMLSGSFPFLSLVRVGKAPPFPHLFAHLLPYMTRLPFLFLSLGLDLFDSAAHTFPSLAFLFHLSLMSTSHESQYPLPFVVDFCPSLLNHKSTNFFFFLHPNGHYSSFLSALSSSP